MQICSAKIIAETDKFFYKKYNYKLAEQYGYNKRETVNLIVTEKLFFIINEDKNAGYENCIVQWI